MYLIFRFRKLTTQRMKFYLLFLIVIITRNLSYSQDYDTPWEHIDDKDNIRVYYRKIENTEIKELKLIYTTTATQEKWVRAISDVERMPEWSNTCRSATIIKKPNINDVYFHFIADVPWPITGRDVVLHMQVFQDSVTNNFGIISGSFDGLVPVSEDYIRTEYMRARWKFTPMEQGKNKIEYFISMKLTNSLPEWLVTKAITYSPIKSINALREIVE